MNDQYKYKYRVTVEPRLVGGFRAAFQYKGYDPGPWRTQSTGDGYTALAAVVALGQEIERRGMARQSASEARCGDARPELELPYRREARPPW